MAVVKNPFLSTDARGSTSGLTASFVRGGNVVKKKSRPATKYEPKLNRTRSVLGWLSREWGELTTAQRDSWGAWAIDHPGTDKFGDPFIMSGFNAFVMLNHTAVRLGTSAKFSSLPPEDPPASAVFSFNAVTGAINPGEVDLSWTETGTGLAADYFEIQIAGPFLSQGRKSVESRFKNVTTVAGDTLLVTAGGYDEGMWYWFRVRYVADNGQITAWHTAQVTPKTT